MFRQVVKYKREIECSETGHESNVSYIPVDDIVNLRFFLDFTQQGYLGCFGVKSELIHCKKQKISEVFPVSVFKRIEEPEFFIFDVNQLKPSWPNVNKNFVIGLKISELRNQ